MKFEFNNDLVNRINAEGTLRGITEDFEVVKCVRNTLTQVLTMNFDDLSIGNSAYIKTPIVSMSQNGAHKLLDKSGLLQSNIKLEWEGLETIESPIYFEYKFVSESVNLTGETTEDILTLEYYIVVPEGLLTNAINLKYTKQFISMIIANELLKSISNKPYAVAA